MVGLNGAAESDAVILSGTYQDKYVKIDGEWKFQHVLVNIGQCSNLAEGWVKQPPSVRSGSGRNGSMA